MVEYFGHIPSSHRALLLVSGLVLFWILEGLIPVFRFNYEKGKHWSLNIFFTVTTVLINLVFAGLILKVSDYVVANKIGVIQYFNNFWLQFVIGLLILDLIGAYLIHYIQHKIKVLWLFHLIHHTDTWVDASSGNRHHPGESVFRALFTTLAVAIAGAPMWMVMLYQSMSVVFTQFNHANIKIPSLIDSVLSWIVVTPSMHRVHHHFVQPYTDSNYGNIFSFWDRIFGTFRQLSSDKIQFGIDTHTQPEENNRLANLLKIPFQTYRPPVGSKFNE